MLGYDQIDLYVAGLKKGDKVAFNELYSLYYHKLYAYLLGYTRDGSLIEDVIQDVFLQIWVRRAKFNVSTSFNSYIYRAVYNNLMDKFRKNKSNDDLLASYYETALLNAVDKNEGYKKEKLRRLEFCIEQLPSRCQKVFQANKINGLRNKEISELFNISLKTVEGHMTKAFKLLKECVGAVFQNV